MGTALPEHLRVQILASRSDGSLIPVPPARGTPTPSPGLYRHLNFYVHTHTHAYLKVTK